VWGKAAGKRGWGRYEPTARRLLKRGISTGKKKGEKHSKGGREHLMLSDRVRGREEKTGTNISCKKQDEQGRRSKKRGG